MTPPVIADSSALVSLASVTDGNHKLAIKTSQLLAQEKRSVIVPGEVVTETINVFGKKVSHRSAVRVGEKLISSKDLLLAETTPEVRRRALVKFKKQAGSVSFTDCLVMAFADSFSTKDIFGFDEVFRKNGYFRLGLDPST
jgi:predicted nucleic acid-binding protein